ncbi:MAG: hypothetical protein M3Q34_00520 [bacterium]|nr:hypothetical protein [bacterium]
MKLVFKNKIPILVSGTLMQFIGRLCGKKFGAVTLYPFIVVRDEQILNAEDYIRHESIHLRQYEETLIIGLLIISIWEYYYARLWLRKSKLDAYYYMAIEQEAHQNDQDINYLNNRKIFSYYKYIFTKNKKQIRQIAGKRIV